MPDLYKTYYKSEIGRLEIAGTETAIQSVRFVAEEEKCDAGNRETVPAVFTACVNQLDQYFDKNLTTFSVKLKLNGTRFQQRVWRALMEIPFGKTASYLDIAKAIGHPGAVRAVGAANGRNPVSIIVPCHRVIGSNGKLTGYGGGLWRKKWLLNHEEPHRNQQLSLF